MPYQSTFTEFAHPPHVEKSRSIFSPTHQEKMEKGQKRKRETSEEEPTLTLPPGLRHSASFLTPDESKKLVEWIELQTWSTTLARKTQHYGYEYSYAKKSVAPKYLGPLPKEFDFILERAKEQCLISETMTQLIINGTTIS